MGLESSHLKLLRGLRAWRDELESLDAVIADHPVNDPVALIDDLGDTVVELRGRIEESLSQLGTLPDPANDRSFIESYRRVLPRVHKSTHQATIGLLTRLASPEKDFELRRLGRLRGGEWSSWTRATREVVGKCIHPAALAGSALCECWTDLTERLAPASGMQQNVTIYQTNRGITPVEAPQIQGE